MNDAVEWLQDKIADERRALARAGLIGSFEAATTEKPAAPAPQSITPAGTKPEDGPSPDGAFVWNGTKFPLGPLEWRLLKFMWNVERASVDAVEQHVWDGDEVGHAALRGVMYRLNKVLLDSLCGRQLHQDQRKLCWEFRASIWNSRK